MPSFPQSGIELVAEASEYLSTIDEVISKGAEVDETMLAQVDAVNAFSDSLGDIQSPDIDIEIPDVPTEGIEIPLDVQESDQAEESLGLLRLIAGAHVFQLILDIAGTALEFFNQIESFTVAPILDVQDAVARFNAQTGEATDGVGDLINQLHFVGDLGEFDDITNTLIAAEQQGIHFGEGMEEAATGALSIAKVFEDTSAVENLRTMNQLVQQGLAEDFPHAADLMTAGLQNGVNRAGDMLQTLNQFGPMFSEMELSGEQVFSLLNSGLDAGFRSTQDVARAISTMNDNISSAAGDIESPVAAALDSIGVELPAAGEQIGADFFNSVIEGLTKNPDAADAAIAAIFGTRTGKFSEALIDLTLADQQFSELEDRATTAATNIDDSLRGALADFILWAQGEINQILSSAEIDLPGKLEELKERIQGALDAITSGAGFGEALEVALEVPGLADIFTRIESAFGNFEIVLLQVVADLAQLIGQAEIAAAARSEVARLGAEQLAFDLKLTDDGAGIASAVQTAIDRGVDEAAIEEALSTAVTELVDEGDIQAAQALLDNLQIAPSFVIDPAQVDSEVDRALVARFQQGGMTDELQTLMHEQGLLVPVGIDTEGMQATVDAAFTELAVAMSDAVARQDFGAAADIAEQLGLSDATVTSLRQQAKEVGAGVKEGMDDAALATEAAGGRIHEELVGNSVVSDLMAVANAARLHLPAAATLFQKIEAQASQSFPQAAYYVNSLVDAIQVGMGNTLPILDATIEKLAQIGQVGTSAREVLTSVATAAGQVNNVTNTTVNVNQTNNVANAAQAASVGMATSRQVRGLAA